MAPVPAFPIPTAADKLPVDKIKLPPGFKVEVWAEQRARCARLRQGDKGTVFVSSLFVAGNVYAIVDKGGKREVRPIAEKLNLPNGIEFHKGALYVADAIAITRYDDIEDKLDNPPSRWWSSTTCPATAGHGWKFIAHRARRQAVRPDRRAVQHLRAAGHVRADLPHQSDGSGLEIVAQGVRNTVGFDLHPKTERALVHRQRPRLAQRRPAERRAEPRDEAGRALRLSRTATRATSPIPSSARASAATTTSSPPRCSARTPAPLGMRFYTGKMFPAKYQDAIFIARHGSWNRTEKYAADVVVA